MAAPLYEELAAVLRQQVRQYEPDRQLPTEAELAQTYRASRDTVRRALGILAREELIESRGRRGWFVRQVQPVFWWASRPEATPDSEAWADDMRSQGLEPTETIRVEHEVADPRVAVRLGLDHPALVVARRRLQRVGGLRGYSQPVLIRTADDYYPLHLVADSPLARPGSVQPSAYAVMRDLSCPWVDDMRLDEERARPGTAYETALFGKPAGSPVIQVIRTRRTEEGRPVAVTIAVSPGDMLAVMRGNVSSDLESTVDNAERIRRLRRPGT